MAAIAQLGERQTEDLKVPGSIPGLGTCPQPQAGGPYCGKQCGPAGGLYCSTQCGPAGGPHVLQYGPLHTSDCNPSSG